MNLKLIFNFLIVISSTFAYTCTELREEIGEYILYCSDFNDDVTNL